MEFGRNDKARAPAICVLKGVISNNHWEVLWGNLLPNPHNSLNDVVPNGRSEGLSHQAIKSRRKPLQ